MSTSRKKPMHIPIDFRCSNSNHDAISLEATPTFPCSLVDLPTRKSKPKRELPSGYHCNLVKPLSKPLQIHCASCLGILCDPCQVSTQGLFVSPG